MFDRVADAITPPAPTMARMPIIASRRREPLFRLAAMCLILLVMAGLEGSVRAATAAEGSEAVDLARLLPDFQRECERLIETTDLRGGRVAISVLDAETGRELVEISADSPMIPASNMKLLTAGAALHILGPDFQFRTRMIRDGSRLIVIGDGDPGFGDPVLLADTPVPVGAVTGAVGFDNTGDPDRSGRRGERGIEVDELLEVWVRSVVAAGITQVSELVIDDRIFDREYVHPSWPRNQLSRRYCAGVAGLNFHSNLLTFYPSPLRGGGATPGPSVPRAGFLEIENNATADRSRSGTASVERRIGTDQLILMGNVRTAYEFPIQVTVNDPPEFFARLLTERLRRAGVTVAEWSVADTDEPHGSGPSVAPEIVTPLVRVLERVNTNSHNLSAEALLKRIGAASGHVPATFTGGASMIRQSIRERLDDERLDSELTIADGSGLSRENRVPPALLTAWLRSFHGDAELGPVLRASMAVMGRTGTLDGRLDDPPPPPGQAPVAGARYVPDGVVVRAKSGTIRSVSGLSGYVIGPRRTLCFSILVNDYAGSSSAARGLQDRIVMLLAEGLADEN